MEMLKIRNWEKWQSYRKDRGQPPWIKVHRRLMRNIEFVSLSDSERGQLLLMWLLAADNEGNIPACPNMIKKLCFMSEDINLEKFIDLGFISPNDAKMTPQGRQDDNRMVCPKAEAEENRIEKEEAFSLPSQEQINESSSLKLSDDLQNICQQLYYLKIFPEAFAFKNSMLKKGKNERAILHALSRCYLKKKFDKDGGPWAYCEKIMQVENGNYNERDHLKTL